MRLFPPPNSGQSAMRMVHESWPSPALAPFGWWGTRDGRDSANAGRRKWGPEQILRMPGA
jgi:hypothetical protein